MIKRILMSLGDAEGASAEIEHAIELARLHSAELTAVTPVDARVAAQYPVGASASGSGPELHAHPAPHSASGWARELAHDRMDVLCEKVRASVERLRERCERKGVLYRIEPLSGEPSECIVAKSRYYDLFLCGSRRIFDYSILDESGDALVRLVANGVRPILAVPREFRPIRRVMIAYSGSVDSAKTMKMFVQSQLVPVLAMKIVTIDQPESEGRRLLSDATAYCRAHGYHAEIERLPGLSRHELLGHADDWGADLIVLGNSDRGMLSRLFFRDASLEIIRDANCALFLAQ